MAKNHDAKGIEEIARNICLNNGVDFEKEFNELIEGEQIKKQCKGE